MANPILVLGIDPNPSAIPVNKNFSHTDACAVTSYPDITTRSQKGDFSKATDFSLFEQAVLNHCNVLDALLRSKTTDTQHVSFESTFSKTWIKPNLAFFLRYGSQGLALLERCVQIWRQNFFILLDAKFSEIGNSLKRSLEFAFDHLGANAVTVNPFMGQTTIETALECALRRPNAPGKIFFLLKTSEYPQGNIAFLQDSPLALLQEICSIYDKVFSPSTTPLQIHLRPHAGVVIGANHKDLLQSQALAKSGLAVLAPGLGAQGASLNVLECVVHLPEVLFPVSRGIFQEHATDTALALKNIRYFQELFSRLPPKERVCHK